MLNKYLLVIIPCLLFMHSHVLHTQSHTQSQFSCEMKVRVRGNGKGGNEKIQMRQGKLT